MNISIENNHPVIEITISGDIDENGADEIKKKFRELSLHGVTQVVVDMKQVSHIGSAGIGKLLVFYKDLSIHGARLSVVNTPDHIHRLLHDMKLDSIFEIK